MELFKSLETRTKLFKDPFKHFEINQPLTQKAINEICNAEIADPKKKILIMMARGLWTEVMEIFVQELKMVVKQKN